MLIGKRQVVHILRDQGRKAEADRAERELPVEVDTVHDADLLRELGVDLVQGYHVGRPVDVAAAIAALPVRA